MSNVDLVRSDGFSKIIASVLCCRGRGRSPAFQAFLSSLALWSRPVNSSRVSSSRESRSRPLRLSTEGTFQVDGISTTPQSPPQVAGWTTEPYHGVPAAPCSVGGTGAGWIPGLEAAGSQSDCVQVPVGQGVAGEKHDQGSGDQVGAERQDAYTAQ